ncbi:MAG: Ig-like domain-containing protein [Clostridia bacterium]|nr:Ig-like domain-containing protein [Clostridia bacterium]
MNNAYGKLAKLLALAVIAVLLFAPMRIGDRDHLYAHPRFIRMYPGDSYDLTYRLDAEDPDQGVSYTSSNEAVAAVAADGRITAVAPGRASILLDAQSGARAKAQVEVVGANVETLTLNVDALTMEKGTVTGLKAIFNDTADNTLVKWSSDDERVAVVDAIGRVSAVGGGTTRVRATSPGGLTAAADISVHVSGNALRITPENVTVGTGAYLRLGTRYIPADTTDIVTHWGSSDESVLRVQENGVLYAAGEGQVVLSAISRDGLSTSTVVTVEPAAADFEVTPAAATIGRGQTLTLEPRFFDAAGNEDPASSAHFINWTSSDPSVATVEDGRVTAVNSGTARISASADGRINSCVITVETLVEEVRLNLDNLYVLREQTDTPIQLEAEILPADADDTRLTWTVDNDLVASVNPRGRVDLTGGYGTATVTATASSGARDVFVVNVVPELPEGVGEEQN